MVKKCPDGSTSPRFRVLLTGHRGQVGRWLRGSLRSAGHTVVGFDIKEGDDVRDLERLAAAAETCDAIIHCAVLQWNWPGPETVMREVNFLGARNALEAARRAGHSRAVLFSSAQVFGVMQGERLPASFPVRDSHPLLAERPYGRLKVEMEREAEAFARDTGVKVFCPRPVAVLFPGAPAWIVRRWREGRLAELSPEWEYGAWVDVRDVGTGVLRALTVELPQFSAAIMAARDSAASRPIADLLATGAPGVPIEDGWLEARGPHAPAVDSAKARELLGWEPAYSWAVESRRSLPQRAWGRFRRIPTHGLRLSLRG